MTTRESKRTAKTPPRIRTPELEDAKLEAPEHSTSEHSETLLPHTEFPAAIGGDPRSQLLHLKKHLEFQKQDRSQKMRINWSTVIDRDQSRRHITNHLHAKINLKATTFSGRDFYQPGKSNTEEALQNMDKMTFMVRSKGRIEAKMGVDRHLSWDTRYRIFRQRYPNLPDEVFWEMMAEDHHRTIAPKRNGFPFEIQVQMAEREQARRDLVEYNRRLRELISQQGGNPDEYKKAVIRTVRYCYSCQQVHPADDDHYQKCPDCSNQLGPKRDYASLIGEWPRIVRIPDEEGKRKDRAVTA